MKVWHEGAIVEAGRVAVSIEDRAFEYGLGLFETMRTWNGFALLLPRHLARLRASATELGIDLDGVALPDRLAVLQLVQAVDLGGDVALRLTVSGGAGRDGGPRPMAWLAARPLPPPESGTLRIGIVEGAYGRAERSVHGHKSLNYAGRRAIHEIGSFAGLDDSLLVDAERNVVEASRNSVLLISEDAPDRLITPRLDGAILPGVMRSAAIEAAINAGFAVDQRPIPVDELRRGGILLLSNALRGIRVVGELDGRPLGGPADLPLVRLLVHDLPARLARQARSESRES